MYSSVKSRVWVNGDITSPIECKLGVRQGESLSPFLFAMYINDLECALNDNNTGISIGHLKILTLFYADDLIIFNETAPGLQRDIDNLQAYCKRWKLSINLDKTQVIVFKKGNRPVNYNWNYNGAALKINSRCSYLGLLFTSNGSFHQAQITLANQANKAIYALNKKLSNFRDLKPDFIMDLFDKFIMPILMYGSEVWGFHAAPAIEKVQLKFCKNLLHVKNSTQNNFIYGELERYPLSIQRQIRITKYWSDIVMGKKRLITDFCIMTHCVKLI
jgi:hypothetical protein